MALNLARLRSITASIPALGNGLFMTTTRNHYVYKDPNFKTLPATFNFKQKHYNPKFRKDRARKVVRVDLPDPNEQKKVDEMTPDEIRAKMKEKGLQPIRPWMEKPMFISSSAGTFEPYVPPEGDGKVSIASKEGAKQRFQFLEKKGKSMMAVRKIRQFEEEFDTHEFASEALQIYINAHKALAESDKENLHKLVTERAYPIVTNESKNKTIRWQFIKSLEPPQVVHARTTDIITKENIFAQVTVRLHTQQTLAVYDRFGRLIHGSEVVARDVLEYVVFEKHVANTYGVWRIHDKIIPDWMPPRQPIRKTYRVEEEINVEEENDKKEGKDEKEKQKAVSAN